MTIERILWAFAVAAMLVGTGCGDDGGTGGGGTGGTGGALQVVGTDPMDMATDVSPDTTVRAMFSDALQETTVTTTSFVVHRSDGPGVAGVVTVSPEGDTALFTPDGPLALLTEYTATLTTEIESLTGSTLDADYQWLFSTRDGAWTTAERIETNDGDGFGPQIALDADGNGLAVWSQRGDTRSAIWSNRYAPIGDWGEAERIEFASGGDALGPQVALDPNGDGLAVWTQSDVARLNIWSNRFTPGAGWGTAQRIETENAGPAGQAQVALDANGNGLAVWSQSDGTRFDIWSNRFVPDDGWDTAERIELTNSGSAAKPQVALDASGSGLAVWEQSDGARSDIWSNRYTPSGGWGTAERIEVEDGDAFDPQVALGASGNGLAVCEQSDGVRSDIWSSRYTPTGGWGTAERIEATDGDASNPQVALDASGNGLSVWEQLDGARSDIWSNRYMPTGGWGTAERIEADDVGPAIRPQVGLDLGGNGLAVWSQFDGTRTNTWSNRYTPSDGWGAAERIEADNAGGVSGPQVGLDPSGNGLAVWEQSDGVRSDIWSNRFE